MVERERFKYGALVLGAKMEDRGSKGRLADGAAGVALADTASAGTEGRFRRFRYLARPIKAA